jgi:hypothetical protein
MSIMKEMFEDINVEHMKLLMKLKKGLGNVFLFKI